MSNGTAVRPKVTKITVEFDDGSQKTYPDTDGYMPVALFWEDKGIEVLAAYYDHVETSRSMAAPALEKHFGPVRTAKILGTNSVLPLDGAAVRTIWNTENPGTLPGNLSKDPGCDVGG